MRRRLVPLSILVVALAALAGPLVVTMHSARGSAAFGDSERIGVNRLSSATVDIESGDRTVTIQALDLAPGDRATGSIEVRNVGTLPLRYAIVTEPSSDPLTQWLAWTIWSAETTASCATGRIEGEVLIRDRKLRATGAGPEPDRAVVGDSLVGLDVGDRIIQPGAVDLLCTSVTLSLDTPDSIQARRLVQELSVVAEQHTDPPAGSTR